MFYFSMSENFLKLFILGKLSDFYICDLCYFNVFILSVNIYCIFNNGAFQ